MPCERIIGVGPATRTTRLSVLTPFFKDDPSPLLEAFAGAPAGVEFILLDDGSCDPDLTERVIVAAKQTGAPARIIVRNANQGRAAARNRLIEEAHGEYVLFLDADMLPDTPHFLAIWLGIMLTQAPRVAFGGLSLTHTPKSRETALHHNLFAHSDCSAAISRARRPAQSTASANLLVRRDFLLAHPFDDGFTGWGFEDVDWALNASKHAEIMHVDNPATHTGLNDVATLMRKSAEAGPNFARLARKHPKQVWRFAAHTTAQALRLAPARSWQRRAYAWLARDPAGVTPMALRRTAFKLFRASHFAEHLA